MDVGQSGQPELLPVPEKLSFGRPGEGAAAGLTIFFQDDISAFVLPDDGWGEGADHITHDHGIFSLPELLWGWRVLEHELL